MIGFRDPPPSCGIADAAPMLLDEPRAALGVLAGHRRDGADDNLDLALGADAEHAEAETAAEVAEARIALAASPLGGESCGEPDLVSRARAVDRLQHELQTERKLQLADHHHRRFVALEPDKIAAADLALAGVAESLQKRLHGPVKRGFQLVSPRTRIATRSLAPGGENNSRFTWSAAYVQRKRQSTGHAR